MVTGVQLVLQSLEPAYYELPSKMMQMNLLLALVSMLLFYTFRPARSKQTLIVVDKVHSPL